MLKRFLFILVSLTLVVSGVPVTAGAKSDCPMAKTMSAEQMAAMPDCHKMAQDKKSGCCEDKSCGIQCSPATAMHVGHYPALASVPVKSPGLHTYASVQASFFLNTQERPPKSLS